MPQRGYMTRRGCAIKAMQYITGRRYGHGYGFERSSDGTSIFPAWVYQSLRAIPDTRYPFPVLEIQSDGVDRWVYGNHQYPSQRFDAAGNASPCAAYSFSQYVLLEAKQTKDDGAAALLDIRLPHENPRAASLGIGAPLVDIGNRSDIFIDVTRYQQISEDENAHFSMLDIDLVALVEGMDKQLRARKPFEVNPKHAALCAAKIWQQWWLRYQREQYGDTRSLQPIGVIVQAQNGNQETLNDAVAFFFGRVFPLIPRAAQAMISITFAAAAEREAQQAGTACFFFYDTPIARQRANVMVFQDQNDTDTSDTIRVFAEDIQIADALYSGRLPIYFDGIMSAAPISELWADYDLALSCCYAEGLLVHKSAEFGTKEIEAVSKQILLIRNKLAGTYALDTEQCAKAINLMEIALVDKISRLEGYQAAPEQIEAWLQKYRVMESIPILRDLTERYRDLIAAQAQYGANLCRELLWSEFLPQCIQVLKNQTAASGENSRVLALAQQVVSLANKEEAPLSFEANRVIGDLLSWAGEQAGLEADCDALREVVAQNIAISIAQRACGDEHIDLVERGAIHSDAVDQVIMRIAEGKSLRELLDNSTEIQRMARYAKITRSPSMLSEMNVLLAGLGEETNYTPSDIDTYLGIVDALGVYDSEKIEPLCAFIRKAHGTLADVTQIDAIVDFIHKCKAMEKACEILACVIERLCAEFSVPAFEEIDYYKKLSQELGQDHSVTIKHVARIIEIHWSSTPIPYDRFVSLLEDIPVDSDSLSEQASKEYRLLACRTLGIYLGNHVRDENDPEIRRQMDLLLEHALQFSEGVEQFAGTKWTQVRLAWEANTLWRWADNIRTVDSLLSFAMHQGESVVELAEKLPWLSDAEWSILTERQNDPKLGALVERVLNGVANAPSIAKLDEQWRLLKDWHFTQSCKFSSEIVSRMFEKLRADFPELCKKCIDLKSIVLFDDVVRNAKLTFGNQRVAMEESALSWCRHCADELARFADMSDELKIEDEKIVWKKCKELADGRESIQIGWRDAWGKLLEKRGDELCRKKTGCIRYACAFLAAVAANTTTATEAVWEHFIKKAHPQVENWNKVDLLRDKTQALGFLSYLFDRFTQIGQSAWSDALGRCLTENAMVRKIQPRDLRRFYGVRVNSDKFLSAGDLAQLGLNQTLLKLLLG